MTSSPCDLPRPKSAAATKQAMLHAAHKRFLRESYENVGLRDIAGDVGVDVALVSRYFGSKEELFQAVLHVAEKGEILPPEISQAEIPAYLAQMFAQQDTDGSDHVERLLIMLRSVSSPTASAIVREALRKDVLRPFADRLGGECAEMRASSLMAVWMGMTIMRTMMAVEPLCQGAADVESRIRRLFEAALTNEA
ncbi:MAG TPA: TetR family transcriptional regulator [Croceibacterium sp.]|nr:TetR family transcriptional regulator [Croceibacterium sp.]